MLGAFRTLEDARAGSGELEPLKTILQENALNGDGSSQRCSSGRAFAFTPEPASPLRPWRARIAREHVRLLVPQSGWGTTLNPSASARGDTDRVLMADSGMRIAGYDGGWGHSPSPERFPEAETTLRILIQGLDPLPLFVPGVSPDRIFPTSSFFLITLIPPLSFLYFSYHSILFP
jgi:hypothetical protein